MSGEKYIGLDVHQATISVAVVDSQGKLIMESILVTKASTILEFLAGLRGTLSVTFEEGTWAAWLYDLLKPHVARLIVCSTCGSKRGANCWRRVANIPSLPSYDRFRRWDRFVLR